MNRTAILNLRKELHQYPELSGLEVKTSKRIQTFIDKHHPTQILSNIGGNGLVAVYEFSNTGPSIAIRCELDALPIKEANQFEHQSNTKGVSHKCGHDGHMAIVSGLVFWLKEQAFTTGRIILLFQPAEETGKGAYEVLQDKQFQELRIDYIFALHNIPAAPLHQIITMERGFSAEVQSFSISLTGKESHASEPENGINPAIGIAEMIRAIDALNVSNPLKENFATLTPIHINMGQKSYGISPAKGELHYTIRTWNKGNMLALKSELLGIFKEICKCHQLAYETNWFEHFPASQNEETCNEYIKNAAKINGFELKERPYLFKFGEDFGWFSRQYKTAMFGLGAGLHTPALHHADYDFPDELIETGMAMFQTIILELLRDENI